MAKRIGFTGTQDLSHVSGQRQTALARRLNDLSKQGWTHFHHGDCIGADEMAARLAVEYGFKIVLHPPDNDSKRAFTRAGKIYKPKPYLERNHDIVDKCDLLIALPMDKKNEQLRSGTWATVRYARKKGVSVLLF